MAKTNGHHPASYVKFTLRDLKQLGVQVKVKRLFYPVPPVAPSPALLEWLSDLPDLRLGSEKAKSEDIIAPIVRDFFRRNKTRFVYFSGYTFDVDPDRGLTGRCDYLFTKDTSAAQPEAPVFLLVEAKNENLDSGIPQCIAEMYAAQIANQQAGHAQQRIFGAVTFGHLWRFLELEGSIAWQDADTYSLDKLPDLLGVLQTVVNRI